MISHLIITLKKPVSVEVAEQIKSNVEAASIQIMHGETIAVSIASDQAREIELQKTTSRFNEQLNELRVHFSKPENWYHGCGFMKPRGYAEHKAARKTNRK